MNGQMSFFKLNRNNGLHFDNESFSGIVRCCHFIPVAYSYKHDLMSFTFKTTSTKGYIVKENYGW